MSPKPWYREFDDWWYVQVRDGGKRRQVKLVKGRDQEPEATRRWHDLMSRSAGKPSAAPAVASQSVHAMVDLFLDHCAKNCAPRTYEWYVYFLSSFCSTIDSAMTVSQIKRFHVTHWLDAATTWSESTKNDGVSCVRRVFRWMTEEGYIDSSPMMLLRGPAKRTRETIISDEKFSELVDSIKDKCFSDLVKFLWQTGVRPQEARILEAKHVDLGLRRVVLPASQSKGKKTPRVFYLDDAAFEIIAARCEKYPTGVLFRNSRGRPWNKNSMRCRFRRLAEKVGTRYCAYNIRHTFATNALQQLDPITVSVLMGHADATTLARTYQHLAKKPEYLQDAARKATAAHPTRPVKSPIAEPPMDGPQS